MILCTEIFKKLSNLNLVFLKYIFHLRETEWLLRNKYNRNLEIPEKNSQVRFGSKSLKFLGSVIWNTLQHHIKSPIWKFQKRTEI